MIGLFKNFKAKKSGKIFIPKENKFEELKYTSANFTITEIIEYLGYHPTQIYPYWGDYKGKEKIHFIAFEIFSTNISFIITKRNTRNVNEKDLQFFLRNFKFEEEFDSLSVKDILIKGIEEKSLKVEFIRKVLELNAILVNEEYYAQKIGVFLFFINGLLISFKLDNDLNEWARYYKNLNPKIISNYAREAKIYWNDDYDRIFFEVNSQCEAIANVPNDFINEYKDLHKTKDGNINFFMLLVCHYGKIINIDEFKTINKGRFETIQPNKFELGKFIYEFDENGIIENIYRNIK
jgi:hypothetical protein